MRQITLRRCLAGLTFAALLLVLALWLLAPTALATADGASDTASPDAGSSQSDDAQAESSPTGDGQTGETETEEVTRPEPTNWHSRLADSIQNSGLRPVFTYGSVILMFLVLFFYPRRRMKHLAKVMPRKQPAQSPETYDRLPSDMTPALVSRLIHFYDTRSTEIGDTLSATWMDMSRKGMLRMYYEDEGIIIETDSVAPPSTPQEQAVLDLIYSASHGKSEVTLYDLKHDIAAYPQRSNQKLTRFRTAGDEQLQEQGLSEKVSIPWKLPFPVQLLLAALIGVAIGLPFGYFLLDWTQPFLGAAIFLVCTLYIVFTNRNNRSRELLSQEGEEQLALWQAFGRYIDGFSKLSDQELPPLEKIPAYLTYATAMGKGQAFFAEIAARYPKEEPKDGDSYFVCLWESAYDPYVFDLLDGTKPAQSPPGSEADELD